MYIQELCKAEKNQQGDIKFKFQTQENLLLTVELSIMLSLKQKAESGPSSSIESQW